MDPWGTDHRSVMGTFDVSPGTPPPYIAVDQRLVGADGRLTVRYHADHPERETGPIYRLESAGDQLVMDSSVVSGPDRVVDIDATRFQPGDYEIRLMDGDVIVARSPFSVAAAGVKPTLTMDAASYKAGAPMTATWRDAPGSRWDWIGIYARGADPLVDSYVFYVYTDQGVQGTVVIDSTGEGDWPLPPGDYDAHYLLDDGYTSLAVAPFTVTK